MASEVVICADRAWDGTSAEIRGPTSVVVRDGRVAEVTGRSGRRGGAETLDLGDVSLLPGLIDCHVHLVTQTEGPAAAVLRALPRLHALLDNGFTTVRDLGCPVEAPVTIELRRAVEEGVVRGPRISVAPRIISASGGHGDHTPPGTAHRLENGAIADGTEQILRTVRRQARAGADWIKFALSGGFTSTLDGPEELGFLPEEAAALVAAARDRGLPTACHVLSDAGVRRAAAAGVSTIEHGTLAEEATLAMLAERRIPVVPTQYVISHYLDRLDDDSFWAEDAAQAKFRTYADALRRGLRRIARSDVEIAFGTDAGMFDHADNWREFPVLVESGLSPLRTLRAATSVAARLLGRDDLGRLAPGCRADLVAVAGDPFHDIARMGQVRFVMQDGAVRLHR